MVQKFHGPLGFIQWYHDVWFICIESVQEILTIHREKFHGLLKICKNYDTFVLQNICVFTQNADDNEISLMHMVYRNIAVQYSITHSAINQ